MKISLITATFNSVRTIGDALDSVARQSTACEIEHIIIDGASSDGTADRVAALIEQNRRPGLRHRLLSEPDQGMYDAMNKGIRMATGDVIGLLNSDDMLAGPDVLGRVAQRFNDPAIAAVYGDLIYVDRDETSKARRVWRSGTFTPRRLSRGWHPAHPTLYLRRRVYERYGLFDLNYPLAADVEFMMRIFSKDIRVCYIPDVLVHMRMGGTSGRLSNLWKQNEAIMHGMRKNGIRVSPLFWPAKIVSRATQFVRGFILK